MNPVTAYIALGANLGDREANLFAAVDAICSTPGIAVTKQSALLENPAVGGPADSPPFLNGVLEIQTTLSPHDLLTCLLKIEQSLGRQRREKWEPRAIDLDVILYGDQVIDTPTLKVPHPLMHQRQFVLKPLAEIAPACIHPGLKQTIQSLLDLLPE